MPIIIPKKLPAFNTMKNENIFVMKEKKAFSQDIRPLKIIIVNLMPTKEVTETQLIRMLSNTPLQVELDLLHMDSHEQKNTSKVHLDDFYTTFEKVKSKRYDGMIITGAPVESLDFKEVDYWSELCEIMEFSKENVSSTLHICWGAQAAFYYHYGIDKEQLDNKLFGVFPHKVNNFKSPILRGFDEEFFVPHSRNAQTPIDKIRKNKELEILAESDEAGAHIIARKDMKQIYLQGHFEYDRETLKFEYERDINKGIDIKVPKNYFRDDDPKKEIVVRWKGHGSLFFTNWLNYCVYQETPYIW